MINQKEQTNERKCPLASLSIFFNLLCSHIFNFWGGLWTWRDGWGGERPVVLLLLLPSSIFLSWNENLWENSSMDTKYEFMKVIFFLSLPCLSGFKSWTKFPSQSSFNASSKEKQNWNEILLILDTNETKKGSKTEKKKKKKIENLSG